MINSVLNRHKDHVHFDNIKTENDLITDPKQIKNHIRDHFDNWTKPEAIADVIYFYCTDEASVIREPVIKVYNNA